MGSLIYGYSFLCAIFIDIGICSFSEHRHGSNGTLLVNTIVEGNNIWIADVVTYSFCGFVCLIIVFHCYLKQERKKKLKKSEKKYLSRFEWERTGETKV